MTQDAEGLKACPFCAAEPARDGPRAKIAHKQGCYLLRFIGSGQLWLAADETGWNTRAPSPVSALVEAIAEYRNARDELDRARSGLADEAYWARWDLYNLATERLDTAIILTGKQP
jgi:hypothetical protein